MSVAGREWTTDVDDRLDIFVKTEIIALSDADATRAALKASHGVSQMLGIAYRELAITFATHVAMAVERARTHILLDIVAIPESDHKRMAEGFALADALMAEMARRGVELPPYERSMLALHLTVMQDSAQAPE